MQTLTNSHKQYTPTNERFSDDSGVTALTKNTQPQQPQFAHLHLNTHINTGAERGTNVNHRILFIETETQKQRAN